MRGQGQGKEREGERGPGGASAQADRVQVERLRRVLLSRHHSIGQQRQPREGHAIRIKGDVVHVLGVASDGADEAPEAGHPVREDERDDYEVDEGESREGEADVILPPADQNRGEESLGLLGTGRGTKGVGRGEGAGAEDAGRGPGRICRTVG